MRAETKEQSAVVGRAVVGLMTVGMTAPVLNPVVANGVLVKVSSNGTLTKI